jgi:hypothetical protein
MFAASDFSLLDAGEVGTIDEAVVGKVIAVTNSSVRKMVL